MSLFSSQFSYLGVDFDTHSTKIVELKNEKSRPRLISYGYFDHEVDYQPDKSKDNIKEIANTIKAVVKKAGMTTKTAVSALPAFSVFSSVITIPAMSKKELAQAIRWEAKKVVPLALEEMNLHWDILDEIKIEEKLAEKTDKKEADKGAEEKKLSKIKLFSNRQDLFKIKRRPDNIKNIKVLLTAAPKNLVNKYINIFKGAGLTLLSLDTQAFSLVRSLIGNDKSTVMIVDMEFGVSNVLIIQDGIPYLNRSVNVGGLTITRAIANSLNISLKRAEQFKYDIGISEGGGQGIPKTIETALAPIIDEIKYSIDLYKNQGGKAVEKVILTGGSSMLQNLPNYLAKILEMRVFLGDPWARVAYPEDLKMSLSEIGPRFAVAIGLAMKEIG